MNTIELIVATIFAERALPPLLDWTWARAKAVGGAGKDRWVRWRASRLPVVTPCQAAALTAVPTLQQVREATDFLTARTYDGSVAVGRLGADQSGKDAELLRQIPQAMYDTVNYLARELHTALTFPDPDSNAHATGLWQTLLALSTPWRGHSELPSSLRSALDTGDGPSPAD